MESILLFFYKYKNIFVLFCLQCDTRIHKTSLAKLSFTQAIKAYSEIKNKKQKTGGIATLLMYISQSSLNLSLQYKIGTFFVGMNSRSIVTQEDGFRG